MTNVRAALGVLGFLVLMGVVFMAANGVPW